MTIAERLDVLERHLPARTGTAFRVDAGDYIRIVDHQGEQAADFWAFHENDLRILLRAEMPSVIGISACPPDITLTCGQRPTDLQVQVLR
jgi:uncharacterized protein YcgI (DUF1989 family)